MRTFERQRERKASEEIFPIRNHAILLSEDLCLFWTCVSNDKNLQLKI